MKACDSQRVNISPSLALVTSARRRLTVFFKLGSICVLIALLHIPLAMTRGVLMERQRFQLEATEAIASTWGHDQLVTGPVLAIPYAYKGQVTHSKILNGKIENVQETELVSATAYFLPESLVVDGDITPDIRSRGIYDTVVYSAQLRLTGEFQPDFVAAGIEAERIDWEKAGVYIGVSDLRGVRNVGSLAVGDGRQFVFEPSEAATGSFLPLRAKVPGITGGSKLKFAVEMAVQGSKRLEIAPIGRVTTTTLRSSWANPSFTGAVLPRTRQVAAQGFSAEWVSSYFSRGFPQSWTNRLAESADVKLKIEAASFGVRFAQAIDGYGMVERAQKYGVLFFVLIFTVFFLFEVTAALKIHPLQYVLVGVALCLFFIAFLALSEFWPTGRAYGISAAACTVMVSLYAQSFLNAGWRTLVIAGGLSATYGYLYFVLKSRDYALIAGTLALFGAVSLVMFCTRRINWYAVDLADSSNPGANAA